MRVATGYGILGFVRYAAGSTPIQITAMLLPSLTAVPPFPISSDDGPHLPILFRSSFLDCYYLNLITQRRKVSRSLTLDRGGCGRAVSTCARTWIHRNLPIPRSGRSAATRSTVSKRRKCFQSNQHR